MSHSKHIIYLLIMIIFITLLLSIMTYPAKFQQNLVSIPLESGGIESIEVTHYGVDGSHTEVITLSEDIQRIYTYWTKIKIGEETLERCDDNTTIYRFFYTNGMIFEIEKECDHYIHDGKSYKIIESD